MAYTASDQVLGWCWNYNGNWEKIYLELKGHNAYDFAAMSLADIKAGIFGKYTTILDADYPEFFKTRAKQPPFCLFYLGDMKVLENPTVTLFSLHISSTEAMEKYSKYAIMHAMKKYAPTHNIVISVDESYRKLAIQAFNKYKGADTHSIEFIDYGLREYYIDNPANERCDLVITSRYSTDSTTVPQEGFYGIQVAASRKVVVTEFPAHHMHPILLMTVESNTDMEVVPYPFFDDSHANNVLIAEGAFIYKEDSL